MNKKITVGFLTSSLSSKDGWGRYSKSLVEAVAGEKNIQEVKVLITKGESNESKIAKAFAILPSADFHPFHQIKTAFLVLKYLRTCDVVHVLIEPYAPAVAIASFFRKIPFVITMHGTYSVPSGRGVRGVLMRFMYRRVSKATTGSVYTEQKTRELVKFGECRFIPNGVDLDKFNVIPGVQKKDFLMTVGEIKSRKGADTVTEALVLLKNEFPELEYNIIGQTDNEKFIASVKEIAQKGEIENRVHFLGRINDDVLKKMYNECKVFVLAARDANGSFEGFPMVFYEANACGTPVISTRGFGSEYAIKENVNGLLVSQNNASELADAIRKLLSNSDLYLKMQDGAKQEALNHTWDKIAGKIVKFYEDVINKK